MRRPAALAHSGLPGSGGGLSRSPAGVPVKLSRGQSRGLAWGQSRGQSRGLAWGLLLGLLLLGGLQGLGVSGSARAMAAGTEKGAASLIQAVIPAKVTVVSSELKLLELATITPLSPELKASLEGVRLGPSPRPGETLTLPGSTLLTRIRSSLPDAAAFRWQVPTQVVVVRDAFRLELPQVQQALEAWIRDNQALPIEQLNIDGLQVKTPIMVPMGAVSLDFEPAAGDDLLGASALTLLVRVNGEVVEQVPVRVRIDGMLRVMVTVRPVRLGQEITDGDVQEDLRGAATLTGQPAIRRDEVVGKVARRALGGNRVLNLDDVDDKPVVRKGDSVMLFVRSGAVLVTCPGEAQQDGRIGQTITVLNTTTRRQLRGKVRADGDVQIDYRSMTDLQGRY